LQKSLIILLVLSCGCTANRYISQGPLNKEKKPIEEIIEDVRKKNISNENYFIEKADFLMINNKEITRFVFTVKFEKPDKFLISIRSSSGIEGARLYISEDTVLINDRINKRLLYGKPKDLERLIGIPASLLNIAFGDLIISKENLKYQSERINNQIIITQKYSGTEVKSVIDEKEGKAKSTYFSVPIQKEEIIIKYSKFAKTEKHFPMIVDLKDEKRNISGKIELYRIKIPWNEKIEFIPGNGYTNQELR
jgi:hypothetical protein